jgi:hypothetical protein
LVTSASALTSVRVYLHKGVGKNVAYAEPWVDASLLSTPELAKLLGRKYSSWEEWRADAAVLQAAATSHQELERVRTAVKTTKKVPRLLPGAGKELFGPNMEEAETRDLETRLKSLGADMDELLNSKELKWEGKEEEDMSEQGRLVKGLVEKMKLVQKALVSLGSTSTEGLKELQVGVAVRLASLEGMLGSFSVLEGQLGFEGATVASALEYLQEQLEEIRGLSQTQNVVAQVMSSNDMATYSEGLKDAFRRVMSRIVKMEEEVEVLHQKGRQEHPQPSSVGSVSMEASRDWFGGLDQSVKLRDDEEERKEELRGDVKEILRSLAERMDAMEKSGGMNSKMEGEDISVFFMGVRFSSERCQ